MPVRKPVLKLSRVWATPLVTGTFALMAVTGVLMFFRLDQGLNKLAHEWLGWLMIGAVVLHVAISWLAFRRYFAQRTPRIILALSLAIIVGSFLPIGVVAPRGPSPPLLVLAAVVNAPLAQVAPLTGRPVERLVEELRVAGIVVQDVHQPLSVVTGGDRRREGEALMVLFGRSAVYTAVP